MKKERYLGLTCTRRQKHLRNFKKKMTKIDLKWIDRRRRERKLLKKYKQCDEHMRKAS